jgi:hypothetical protein
MSISFFKESRYEPLSREMSQATKVERRFQLIPAGMMFLVSTINVSACPECRARVQSGIYDEDFPSKLLIILLPVAVLLAAGFILYFAPEIKSKIKEENNGPPK